MNFWMKTISRILFISALCTAIIFCSGYIHFVIFLPVCLLLVNIKYLLLLYSLTSSALVPQPFLLTPPFWSFPFKGEKRPFRDSLFWWSLLRPSKHFHFFFFSADLFCHKCNTLNSTIFLKLLSLFLFLLSFCPCFHAPPRPTAKLPLSCLSLHLMPLFQILLLLHSAWWNTL